jgi:hypothetical protein
MNGSTLLSTFCTHVSAYLLFCTLPYSKLTRGSFFYLYFGFAILKVKWLKEKVAHVYASLLFLRREEIIVDRTTLLHRASS